MSTTSPINGLPIPDDNSPGDPPIHFQAFSAVLDTRLNARFASTAERDAAIPTPTINSECWVSGVGKQVNTDGTIGGWVTVFDATPFPRPFGYLQGSGTQTLTTAGWDQQLLNQQMKLVNMGVTLAGGILKATIAGWYEAAGSVNFTGQTGGRRIAAITKNGAGSPLSPSQNSCYPSNASTAPLASATIPVQLNVNDYVQLSAYQDSGSSITIDRTQCFLKLTWIGPL